MRKILLFTIIIVGTFFLYSYLNPQEKLLNKTPNALKSASTEASAPSLGIVADKLQIPWSLAFLPDGSAFFTERPGRVRQLNTEGSLMDKPLFVVKDVKTIGEGGLLGIALHPDFSRNHFVYLYYTYSGDANRTLNKVVRYVYDKGTLKENKTVITGIPGNSNHNGGRMKFGPDGYLYITTGDSQDPSLSQDTGSLAGKILRVDDEGGQAEGNPFNNLTYSYGHRNPQGIDWDGSGQLWSTEHGPSAGDEVNLISAGKNYGWPDITRNQTNPGMETPVINSGSDTWAPAGLVFVKPYLYFAGLRSNTLFRYNTETKRLEKFLQKKYGRLRDVVLGPDGLLYILTSNMDGRSVTHLDGDKIIRLDPQGLQ